MKLFLFLFVSLLSFSDYCQIFNPTEDPIEFLGTEQHFRSVWFSSDNKMVYGDDKSIFGFDMNTKEKTFEIPIEGYSLYPSSRSSDQSIWISGNSNYNDPKNKQITAMHANLFMYNFKTKSGKAQKTGDSYISKVQHSSKENNAYGVSRKSGRTKESVVNFQINPFKVERTIVSEDSPYYILAAAANESEKILAYGYAGSSKGIKIVDLSTGSVKKNLKISEEFGTLIFSKDQKHLYAGAFNKLYKIDLTSYEYQEFDLDPLKDGSYAFAVDIHPNGQSAVYSSKYGTSILDLTNGNIKNISKGQSMACKFSENGRFLAVSNKSFAGKTACLRVYIDPQFASTNTSTEGSPLITEESVFPPAAEKPSQWFQQNTSDLYVKFPKKPEISTKTSKKGYLTTTYKSKDATKVCVITITEVSQKVKSSKYHILAEKTAANLVEKTAPESMIKKPYSYEGQKGVMYTMKKGNLDYVYKVVCINGKVYQIIYVTSAMINDDMNYFFDSFKTGK